MNRRHEKDEFVSFVLDWWVPQVPRVPLIYSHVVRLKNGLVSLVVGDQYLQTGILPRPPPPPLRIAGLGDQ